MIAHGATARQVTIGAKGAGGFNLLTLALALPQSLVHARLAHPSSDQCDALVRKCKFDKMQNMFQGFEF